MSIIPWFLRRQGRKTRPRSRDINVGTTHGADVDREVASVIGCTVEDAREFRRIFLAVVASNMDSGRRVVLQKFGTFHIARSPARSGRAFGEDWHRPERDVPRVDWSDILKGRIAELGAKPRTDFEG